MVFTDVRGLVTLLGWLNQYLQRRFLCSKILHSIGSVSGQCCSPGCHLAIINSKIMESNERKKSWYGMHWFPSLGTYSNYSASLQLYNLRQAPRTNFHKILFAPLIASLVKALFYFKLKLPFTWHSRSLTQIYHKRMLIYLKTSHPSLIHIWRETLFSSLY